MGDHGPMEPTPTADPIPFARQTIHDNDTDPERPAMWAAVIEQPNDVWWQTETGHPGFLNFRIIGEGIIGYQTDFDGQITIEPPLNPSEIEYLTQFNEVRHMDRTKGPYFVSGSGPYGQGNDDDIVNHNSPCEGQPGLWCQWTPADEGTALEWDQGEKAYSMAEWLEYLIDHFLKPGAVASTVDDPQFADFTFDHVCNGTVDADGEDSDDHWRISVTDNQVAVLQGTVTYEA